MCNVLISLALNGGNYAISGGTVIGQWGGECCWNLVCRGQMLPNILSPPTRNYLVQNVNSATVDKSWIRGSCLVQCYTPSPEPVHKQFSGTKSWPFALIQNNSEGLSQHQWSDWLRSLLQLHHHSISPSAQFYLTHFLTGVVSIDTSINILQANLCLRGCSSGTWSKTVGTRNGPRKLIVNSILRLADALSNQ